MLRFATIALGIMLVEGVSPAPLGNGTSHALVGVRRIVPASASTQRRVTAFPIGSLRPMQGRTQKMAAKAHSPPPFRRSTARTPSTRRRAAPGEPQRAERKAPSSRRPAECQYGCIASLRIHAGIFVQKTFKSAGAYRHFLRVHPDVFVEMTSAMGYVIPQSRRTAKHPVGSVRSQHNLKVRTEP